MTSNAHFFYSQAGYSYPVGADQAGRVQARWQGARNLARAEQWAQSEGLVYLWEEDQHIDIDNWEFEEDREHVRRDGARCCILYRPCEDHGIDCKHAEVLASLGGITESFDNQQRDNYRRVVEAELACEVMPNGE